LALTAFQLNPKLLELIRLHFCLGKPRTRRNIYSLLASNANHPIVASYRQGVSVMKGRPDSDPTSWNYQANIHATFLQQSAWPPGAPFDTCQHFTIFFLAWHRVYLYFFERIVRAASGNPDFALPYWDYGQPGQSALPPPFRNPTIGPTSNSLYDGTRAAPVNGGSPLPPSAVDASVALSRINYLAPSSFQSALEGTPHGSVHVSIGGNMGFFEGAGRDPIFWLHHCNIDRLWEKWLSQGGGRVNPVNNSTWMNTEYTFVDENKNFVTMSASDVLHTVSQLGYQYEDPHVCIPLYFVQAVLTAAARTRLLSSFVIARNVKPDPGQGRVDLRVEDADTRERLARTLASDTVAKAIESGARYTLVFEGVQTEAPLNGYFEVYLGLPRDAKPDFKSPYYVGNLTTFGADARSRRQMMSTHAGHAEIGIQVELDLTEPMQRLVQRKDINPNDLSITLVPTGVTRSPDERFIFDPRAFPQIGSILLNVEKDE
jgi:tyrosinase